MIDIRQPHIQGSDKEQLAQIRAYLFQLRDQLQYAFDNTLTAAPSPMTGNSTTIITQTTETVTRPPTEQEAVDTFQSIKGLIIKSADIVNKYYEEIDIRLKDSSEYVMMKGEEGFERYKEDTNLLIQQNADGLILQNEKVEIIDKGYEQLSENVDNRLKEAGNKISDIEKNIDDFSQVFQTGTDQAAYVVSHSGYVKTGYIGNNKYGVEIGEKKSFNGKSVFSGNMQVSPHEIVMKVGEDTDENPSIKIDADKKILSIDKVEARSSQQVGGFIDEVDISTGDVTTRWIGKDE